MNIAVRELHEAWLAMSIWTGPSLAKAEAARQKGTENFAIFAAGMLPWSTSATSIGALIFLVGFLATVTPASFYQSLRYPASASTLLLCLLALLGLIWAVDIPWSERVSGLSPMGKFLVIPPLIYCFRRSSRGRWAFFALVASCTILMLYSWVALYFPHLSIHNKIDQPGVPVKNYIDQSQEFAFCAFGLAALAIYICRMGRLKLAMGAAALACAFLINLAFVNVARTALVYCPLLAAMLAYRSLSGKRLWILIVAIAMVVAGLWTFSPNLQRKVAAVMIEYQNPRTTHGFTSVAERLEYWRKSIKFFWSAPIVGHGTGSVKTMFQRDAIGETGLAAVVIGNPHNQTLMFAIQWGFIGCFALYAMWMSHLFTFREASVAAWIGLMAVSQNIMSSIFNSHLTDFSQGWLYVLAVGIAGGTISKVVSGSRT